jgi:hypothetical protein
MSTAEPYRMPPDVPDSDWILSRENMLSFLNGTYSCGLPYLVGRTQIHRAPAADILGAGVLFSELPDGELFQSWLLKIEDLALRQKIYFDLTVINAINPQVPLKAKITRDRSLWDRPEEIETPGTFAHYLNQWKESGFRVRYFDLERQNIRLFDYYALTLPRGGIVKHLQFHFDGCETRAAISFFRAIETRADLPPENTYIDLLSLTARLNCPKLLQAFAGPGADFSFRNLRNRTLLHEAVLGLADKSLDFLLNEVRLPFDLEDVEGNTLLHTLASLPDPGESNPEGRAEYLNIFEKIETQIRLFHPEPDFRKAFFQKKNHKDQTALQVAADANNQVIMESLLFVLGAKLTEINIGEKKTHLGVLINQRIAVISDELRLIQQRIFELQETMRIRFSEVERVFRALATLMASQRRESRRELHREVESLRDIASSQQQQIALLMGMLGGMASLLEQRRVLPEGSFALLMRTAQEMEQSRSAGTRLAGAGLESRRRRAITDTVVSGDGYRDLAGE